MSTTNHLNFIIAMLRDNGDTETAEALESGKGDKDSVKRALNSIKISGMAETDIKKLYPRSIFNYAMNDIINTTDVVKHFKG